MATFTTALKQLSLITATVAVITGLAEQAKAATLTFQTQPLGPFTTLLDSGFQLDYTAGDLQVVDSLGGNNVLLDSNATNPFGALISITRVGGGLFNLESLDIANLLGSNLSGPTFVPTGGDYRVELTSNTGSIVAYTTDLTSFSTIIPTGFTGISSLGVNIVSNIFGTFTSNQGVLFAVDNIVLTPIQTTPVPEPTSIAGLVVFGAMGATSVLKRKQRQKATQA